MEKNIFKVGDKVHSQFYGEGTVITVRPKGYMCVVVKFTDHRINEFTTTGNYLRNLSTFKAIEMNNQRKISLT
jgi:hypothetical protein